MLCGASSTAKGPHQPDHAVLGCGVVRHGRHADQARRRADEDQRSAFIPFDHVGDHRLDGLPRPRQIDVDDLFPGLVGKFPREPEAGHSGIRAHDVDVPELGYRLVDDILQFVGVARICPARKDPPPQLFDQLRRRGEILTVCARIRRGFEVCAQVDGYDVRTLLGEAHRMRTSHSPRSASDQCDFPGDPAHFSTSTSENKGVRFAA